MSKQPLPTKLDPKKTYHWCACGHSDALPFCNGQHAEADSVEQPLAFQVKDTHMVWLCTCQATQTPPYCDGSHNHLNADKQGFWRCLSKASTRSKR